MWKRSPLLKNWFQSIRFLLIVFACMSLNLESVVCFVLLMLSSGHFITVFLPFRARTQTGTNPGSSEEAAQPLLAFISVWVRLHNPPLTGAWAFLPQLLTLRAVFVSVLWHFSRANYTQRLMRGVCPDTPAEMQINSRADEEASEMKYQNNLNWHVPYMPVLLPPPSPFLPPSSARRASCQAAALWKDALREETSNQKKRSSERRTRAAGDVAQERRRVQRHTCGVRRCFGVSERHQRAAIGPQTGWQQRCSPHSHLCCASFAFRSHTDPRDSFLTLSTHRFSPRVWLFVATLPPSKQNVLARGGKKKKKSHSRLWCNIYFLFIYFYFFFF